MAISSSKSATAYGFSQMQRQVAQRNAEQLAAKAQSLAAAAANARKEAEVASRVADRLEIDAGSARSAATNALQSLATSDGAVKLAKRISEQADRLNQSAQSDNSPDKLYSRNGKSSKSSYKTGSIVDLAG